MDTQDVVEIIKMWNNFYVEMQKSNGNVSPEDLKKWKESMLKIASLITIPDSVRATSAEKNLQVVIEITQTRDENKLEEIYKLLSEVENFFKDAFV
ncbi:MAG: hypothetical protein KA120_04965 [Candidatus Goldbacteria bacterium]|nr:hypothetical protein [Candidatus Goldiibacteriota bacterium]